jgi:phosphoribosylanthranilate isomerase
VKTRVKICGVTRVRDARLAVSLGASMIGCVMARDSKRRATPAQVAAIVRAIGDSVPVVLVYRTATEAEVLEACSRTGARTVQINSASELENYRLESQGLSVIRVHPMSSKTTSLPRLTPAPRSGRIHLLDHGAGGTGKSFNWKMLGSRAPRHVFVAGGVNPDNVEELMKVKPFGIDLSSGVEASPGVKDAGKLRSLFAAIGGAS